MAVWQSMKRLLKPVAVLFDRPSKEAKAINPLLRLVCRGLYRTAVKFASPMKKERDSEHYRSDPRWFLAPGQVPKVTFGFVLREYYLQALPAPFTATLHSGHDRGRHRSD